MNARTLHRRAVTTPRLIPRQPVSPRCSQCQQACPTRPFPKASDQDRPLIPQIRTDVTRTLPPLAAHTLRCPPTTDRAQIEVEAAHLRAAIRPPLNLSSASQQPPADAPPQARVSVKGRQIPRRRLTRDNHRFESGRRLTPDLVTTSGSLTPRVR
jgi:hypothetical protein